MSGMERVYRITGMTCGHCVAAVEKELRTVAGVSSVHVELADGTATVTGQGWSDDDVRAAVDEAGYALAG